MPPTCCHNSTITPRNSIGIFLRGFHLFVALLLLMSVWQSPATVVVLVVFLSFFWLFCLCGWMRIDGIHFPPLARVVLLCSLGGRVNKRRETGNVFFLFFNEKKNQHTERERETQPTKKNVRERAERFKIKNQMKRDAMENEWERKKGKKKREGFCCLVLLLCKRERERERAWAVWLWLQRTVDQMWHGPAFILLSSLHMSGPKGGGAALRRLPDALPFSSTIRSSSSSLLLGVLYLLFFIFFSPSKQQQQITTCSFLPPHLSSL